VADVDDQAEMVTLLKEQRAEGEAIRRLSTSLRMTPQSLSNHRGNKNQITETQTPHRLANAS
jgi:hypothetical protein